MIKEVEPQDVPDIVVECEPVDEPVVLVGSPGVGKSFIIRECARRIAALKARILGIPEMTVIENPPTGYQRAVHEYALRMFNATYLEPEDFVFPNIREVADAQAMYERLVIDHLPREPFNLMSFEEIAKKPDLFKILAQLMNEGRLGLDYVCPEHTYFMATSNQASDGAGAFDFHTDLINRAMILIVKPTAEGFCRHHDGELAPEVMGLLKWFPDLIMTFDSSARKKPFASPRSIFKFNEMLRNGTDFERHASGDQMMLGMLGEKFTVEFKTMVRAFGRLGNIDAMLSDPDNHHDEIERLKNDTSHNGRQTLCSMIVMLAKRVKKDPFQYNNIVKFMERIDDESAVTFTHIAMQVNPKVKDQTEFGRHYARNQGFYF